jgi:4-diphosphocytidyl-2-C-methyl-D-erythritol kinase
MKLTLSAPAKINWFLAVLGRREDGFHDIASPVQMVSLFDTLTFQPSDRIELETDTDLNIPAEENLVCRAAALLRENTPGRPGVRISLRKEIPAAAGLGGGSSDAACTLRGLNSLWGLNAGEDELMALAARLGSDVPFFLGGRFSLMEGRGEKLTPLKTETSPAILLVKPDIEVSTAWAYRSWQPEKLTKNSFDIKLFCRALDRKDFLSLRGMVFNDLENAVTRKHRIIAEIKEMLLDKGAVLSSMSGSGPTVFGLFPSLDEAERATAGMGENWCRVVKTLI